MVKRNLRKLNREREGKDRKICKNKFKLRFGRDQKNMCTKKSRKNSKIYQNMHETKS